LLLLFGSLLSFPVFVALRLEVFGQALTLWPEPLQLSLNLCSLLLLPLQLLLQSAELLLHAQPFLLLLFGPLLSFPVFVALRLEVFGQALTL
jgi:hypothetical protein